MPIFCMEQMSTCIREALRGGHMANAMRAAKYAAERNLPQSTLMQSTVRQVRRYKESLKR